MAMAEGAQDPYFSEPAVNGAAGKGQATQGTCPPRGAVPSLSHIPTCHSNLVIVIDGTLVLLEPSPLSPALARRVSLRPPQLSKGGSDLHRRGTVLGCNAASVCQSKASNQAIKQACWHAKTPRLVEAIEI